MSAKASSEWSTLSCWPVCLRLSLACSVRPEREAAGTSGDSRSKAASGANGGKPIASR